MRDLKTARVMLLMAGKDFCALSAMDNADTFSNEIFGFHVQQAVEKGIKAWLCCLGVAYPKKHDLDDLANLLRRSGEEMPDMFTSLLDYSDFAITYRYDAYPEFGREIDRQETSHLVEGLLEHVKQVFQRENANP